MPETLYWLHRLDKRLLRKQLRQVMGRMWIGEQPYNRRVPRASNLRNILSYRRLCKVVANRKGRIYILGTLHNDVG